MLHLDFETRSVLDLTKVGVYRYVKHQSTEIMCMAYAEGNGPVQIWDALSDPKCEDFPWEVVEYVEDDPANCIAAWNANFERVVWNSALRRQLGRSGYDLPRIENQQWWCVMADAAAMGVPLKLDTAAKVIMGERHATLGEEEIGKYKPGAKVLSKWCKPRRIVDGRPEWWPVDDAELAELLRYCQHDVVLERDIAVRIPRLPAFERRVWLVDCDMNDRGITVDIPMVQGAIAISNRAGQEAEAELASLTDGEITAPTQHARFARFFAREVDSNIVSADKEAMQRVLTRKDLTWRTRRVAEIRVDAAKSSAAKLVTMRDASDPDDQRIRGMLQYGAAHTLRWGGRLVQPQNFPRGEIPDVERYIEWITAGDYDALDVYHAPRHVLSASLRSMLTAARGHLLSAFDYSAIEVRVLAWLAGQEDALDRYRNNEDQYVAMAAYIFGIPPHQVKKGFHRNLGKNCVLGCGFGMGPDKFKATSARAPYFMDIDDAMSKRAVDGYRELWDKVPLMWRGIENMVLRAVTYPRVKQTWGKLAAVADASWLLVRLPSGRNIYYRAPMLGERETPWGVPQESVSVAKVDDTTRQIVREHLWGGLLTENVVQATARELMADAMVQIADRGGALLLTIHDELVAEAPADEIDALHVMMADCMLNTPAWASGLPIAVEGWTGERYRK